MTVERKRVSSNAPWESAVAYSRAVRVGPHVYVAGTTATDENGRVVGHGDAYTQAKYVLKKIEKALQEAGASMADVVRTRMYVTDVDHWKRVGAAHAEFFKDVRPAATVLGVSSLIVPEVLVEIEADAFVGG